MLDRRSFFGAAVAAVAGLIGLDFAAKKPFRVKHRLLSSKTNMCEWMEDYWITSGYVEFEGDWDEEVARKELAWFWDNPTGYKSRYSHYEISQDGMRIDIFRSFVPVDQPKEPAQNG